MLLHLNVYPSARSFPPARGSETAHASANYYYDLSRRHCCFACLGKAGEKYLTTKSTLKYTAQMCTIMVCPQKTAKNMFSLSCALSYSGDCVGCIMPKIASSVCERVWRSVLRLWKQYIWQEGSRWYIKFYWSSSVHTSFVPSSRSTFRQKQQE